MIRLEVQIDASSPGWATVVLHTEARVLDIPCSDLGGDSLGELARAFVKLMEIEHKRVEIDCYGEPQNTRVALHRRGSDLEVTIKRFSWEGDGAPADTIRRAIRSGKPKEWKKMERARNKKAKLRERGPFVDAMRSLAESFQRIEDQIGGRQYKRAWGFTLPSAELAVMRQFLSRHERPKGTDRGD